MISFQWFLITGRKIAKQNGGPMITRSAVQTFVKRYHIKVRKVQRKKQQPKDDFTEKIKQWHLNYRESLIKSQRPGSHYDCKWGRFKPYQRINVDQVPLPFVLDKTQTYERPLGRNEKVWVSHPGSGLEKRQCTLQIAFSPENNRIKIEIIFRGTCKGIKEMVKRSYHPSVDVDFQKNAWADTKYPCDWVNKTLKPAITEGEEFVLLCDNLTAQTSEDFKSAVKNINGIVWYGLPGATDIWQPVDAGYGWLLKKLTAKAQNDWLELEENLDTWMGNNEKTLTASDHRILITQWVGKAADTLVSSEYDHFCCRCFEKTG